MSPVIHDESNYSHTTHCSYGLVGILRPLSVYPSEMVYWAVRDHSPLVRGEETLTFMGAESSDGVHLPK